jgi:hypothetical protein
MKTKIIIYSISILTFFSSCVSKSEHDKIVAANDKLKIELDECQNGAEKLIANIEKAYSKKNYSIARENIILLSEKHPESSKINDFNNLLKTIEEEELVEENRKKLELKEKTRLENLNNTGIWSVQFYVDDFGEPTKEGYVKNTDFIRGVFSNSATQNSDLKVKFLISNSSDVSIMLYEYAGNNPVKAYSAENYRVLIQDKEGDRLKLTATNYSDRLGFNKTESRKVHNVLMKGGIIKFVIYEIDTPTTEYNFTIQNSDWYDNAYAKLKES